MTHLFLILGLTAAATIANANNQTGKKGDKFEHSKEEQLARIEKRQAVMDSHRECISSAQSPEERRACNEKMRDMRLDMRKENMGKRQEMHEKRKDMHEKRKKRMDDKAE